MDVVLVFPDHSPLVKYFRQQLVFLYGQIGMAHLLLGKRFITEQHRLLLRVQPPLQVFIQRRDHKPAARRRLPKPVGKDRTSDQALDHAERQIACVGVDFVMDEPVGFKLRGFADMAVRH